MGTGDGDGTAGVGRWGWGVAGERASLVNPFHAASLAGRGGADGGGGGGGGVSLVRTDDGFDPLGNFSAA